MLGWQKLSQQLEQMIKIIIYFIKARRREEAALGVAGILFWLGTSLIGWLSGLSPNLVAFITSWRGNLILPGILYFAGLTSLIYGIYRIWRLVIIIDSPPPTNKPSAIKGPSAFTSADGELFRKLGRENELKKLLGYIKDDQICLVVLMGASGVGKTSLLRAGLTNILEGSEIKYHYWEAVPSDSGQGLLRAIKESWHSGLCEGINKIDQPAPPMELKSVYDLVNPSPALTESQHVIVLDQFEQLSGNTTGQIFQLLRKVARKAKPPHKIKWIVAFRREYRADWSDFIIPENERGFFPPELSLRLFTSEQARNVIDHLIFAAGLSIEQKVIDNLIEATTVDGEVSSVDIGIGLLVLSEIYLRQGGKTVTNEDYRFRGGAEGLLTQYVSMCLDNFSDKDRETILNAMRALYDIGTNQRDAEGKTCDELAEETKTDARRLKIQLERLTQRDKRLLEQISTDNDRILYRLPHERLIPAINRLARRLSSDWQEAKDALESTFPAWKKTNARRFLLKGKDLRLVEHYKNQIKWGRDEQEKLKFLKHSQKQRSLKRIISVILILSLIASGWFAGLQYQRYKAGIFLRDNSYPAELYDWQDQLKSLQMDILLLVQPFPWLRSTTLEEFTITIKVPNDRGSFERLIDNLARCPALRKIALEFGDDKVNTLEPLSKLTNLTQLDLDISGTQISSLEPLSKLTNLTQLKLSLPSSTEESDESIEPLSKLTNLTQLDLDISGTQISSLEPLSELTHLTHLDLDLVGTQISSLEPLSKLTSLTHFNVTISDIKSISSLEPLSELTNPPYLNIALFFTTEESIEQLSKLTNLTQLSLDISGTRISSIEPLSKLTNLTQLSLDISGSKKISLEPLSKLTNLTQLGLDLSGSKISNLEPLSELTNLTQLVLDLRGDSEVNDLTPLSELTSLTQLKLILTNNPSKVSDLTALSKLTNLTLLDLDLGYAKLISSLEPLSKLTNLTQLNLDLNLSGSKSISSLEPLSKLTNLTQLNLDLGGDILLGTILEPKRRDIFSGSKISDLEPLSKLTNLTQLNFKTSNSKISNLEPLSKLTNLTQLDLDLGNTEVTDLTPLSNLQYLTKFVLGIRKVEKLEMLSKIVNLTHLDLDLTGSKTISSLEPLSELTNLTQLSLNLGFYLSFEDARGSKTISSLEPLSKLTNLTQLSLDINNSEIISLEPLSKLTNLTQLDLDMYNSDVRNFEPLAKLNCNTLKLELSTEQRILLKAIPKSVTHLKL